MDAAGNLYGTTVGEAVVYELSQSRGNWTEQVLFRNTTGGRSLPG
ncbi:MAG: hypothetical protein ABSD75_17875 [Terriglobales bacterium]|jgi:hypothetical protein